MARSHMRWKFGAWDKPDHRDVPKDSRHLFMVICADETINQAGIVALRPGVWAEDAAMTDDEVDVALVDLEERRFVVIDPRTAQLLVRTFIRNDDVYLQPNVLRSALGHARTLRSARIKRVLADELRKLPAAPPPKTLESGRLFSYPDPHHVADLIDPDGPRGPGSGTTEPAAATPPQPAADPARETPADAAPNPSRIPSRNPSGNPSPNPPDDPWSEARSEGFAEPFPEPFAEGSGEGEGEGEGESPSVGDQFGGRAHTHARRRAPARGRTSPSKGPRTDHAHAEQPCGRRHDPEAPCGPCGIARRADAAVASVAAADDVAARRARRAAIDACPRCDPSGLAETDSGLVRCTHPTADPTETHGAAS